MLRPIDQVVARTKELGLKCERFTRKETADGFHPRNLLIQGRKCQVVSARIQCRYETLPVHFPTSLWPDFLIYVTRGSGPCLFFIVPRGMIATHTSVCSIKNWIFQFQDAWSLLTENLPTAELERRFRPLNWKMQAIISAANKNGCPVELIAKTGGKWPYSMQNRFLINGRRCQVMSASRISKDSTSHLFNVVNIRKPYDEWAEFVFYIVRGMGDEASIFIMPKEKTPTRTTVALTGWLWGHGDAWGLVGGTATDATRPRPVKIKRPRLPRRHGPIIAIKSPRNVTAASLLDEALTLLSRATDWRKRTDGIE